MSTKTTFKRIALVAVAAMGFGMLSVVPSSAVNPHTFSADVLSISATSTTGVTVGSTASITVTMAAIAGTSVGTGDSMTVSAAFVSAPAGATAGEIGDFVFTSGSNVTSNIGTRQFSFQPVTANLYTEAKYTLKLTPTKAGTYVIRLTPAVLDSTDTTALNAVAQTWTVTVAAAAAVGAGDSTSTATLTKGVTAAVSAGSADQTVLVPMATGSAVAVIDVTSNVASLVTTGSVSVTVVLTGPGTVGMGDTSGTAAVSVGKSFTYTRTDGTAHVYAYVYADGTSGTASIAVSLGSVLVATKTVKFYGAAASVTTTQLETVVGSGSGAVSTGVLVATVKDAAGNVVPSAALFVISSSSAVFASGTATTGSAGTATISVLGRAAGTATLTVQNVAAGSTATFSAPAVSVRAGDTVASSVTLTLDKATYSQGEAAILTVTVKDAAGNLVAPGTQDIFTAQATSTRVTAGASLPAASFTSAGSAYGVTTYKINVPTTSGAFTISATGADTLAAAQAGLAISVTATVSQTAAEIANADAIAAAQDAAAEATDAANAATDAANAAAEAADAATAAAQDAADAVATLGTQVAELVAGLKAQIAAQKAAITALTNLVIKIQKKLKA